MFQINYCKTSLPDLSILREQYLEDSVTTTYNPYDIRDIQLYNPIYRNFFEMNEQNYNRIMLNHDYCIQDLRHVFNANSNEVREVPIFVKFSPLLDPYRYMTGKYGVQDPRNTQLPQLNSKEEIVHSKILSPNNASYVDCFFNYLSCKLMEQYGFPNGVHFYGSFLGIQSKYRISVSDDYEYLHGSDFFNENVGKLFFVDGGSDTGLDDIKGSRRNRPRLTILPDDSVMDPVTDLLLPTNIYSDINITEKGNECEMVYTKQESGQEEEEDSDSCSDSSESSHSNSDLNYSSSSELASGSGSSDSESYDSESESKEIYAYIQDFPVQMICMEKCSGTLDELFVNHQIDANLGASALFQIVMSLIAYQKAFSFTHNDLHTNNVMYVNTDQEYLFYKYGDKLYRVPTYGRIFKIIDFGRGIYRFQKQLFCSDSFAPGGDAVTQYNCEPFMNSDKPRLDPNYGFDLCRLGCSIFDFIMDIDDDPSEWDELQQTINRWCSDDNGKNILYKRSGEERYPNFKMYKMIARTSHTHTPQDQLDYPFFGQFMVDIDLENPQPIFNIDSLPSCV
jgi:hypothetical protein